MNLANGGGSSRVLRRALKASLVTWCTSSMMYTFETRRGGLVAHVLDDLADLVDAPVRGAVDLVDVEGASLVDLRATGTLVARRGRGSVEAIQGLGQDARGAGLAHAADPGEQVAMGDAAALDSVGEHTGDVLLPHHVRKALGTPLTGQDEIRHDVQRRSECPQRTFEPPSGGDFSPRCRT